MDLLTALLFVVAVFNTTLGILVFAANRKELINASYGLAVANAGIWCFGLAMFRLSESLLMAHFWAVVYYTAAALIAYFFFLFSISFPFPTVSLRTLHVIALTIPFIIIATLLEGTSLHIQTITFESWGKNIILGPAYFFYSAVFLVFMTWAFINLVRKYRLANREQCIQLHFVVVGNLCAIAFGTIFNLLLPLFGNYQYIWLGPYFSLIMVALIGYAIVRHQLLNIKVIAATIVTGVILIVLLFELFIARTPGELILRSVFFVLVAFFCSLLVGSVRREVRQREELQVLTTKLEAANRELARLDQAKSEFLSIASHQLRTPLTAIRGYVSMLIDGTFGAMSKEVRGGLEKVSTSTDHMVELVNDLLDSSRLESGRMKFAFEELDLGTLAGSVCDELAVKADAKKLAIDRIFAAGTSKVWVDAMKIRQVMTNYLDNAVKYSDTGPVVVSVGERKGEVVCAVRDRGWGMTSEEMGFLFKKFSRGRGDLSQIKGTGLGLYVCRRLLEAHGGRVWAESEGKGKGSTFFFALKIGWKPDPAGVYLPSEE